MRCGFVDGGRNGSVAWVAMSAPAGQVHGISRLPSSSWDYSVWKRDFLMLI